MLIINAMTLTWCSLFFRFLSFLLQVSHFLSRSLVAEGPLPQSWVMYGSLIVIHCDYAWASYGKYVSPPQLYESLYGLFAAAAALLSWIQTANSFDVCRERDKTWGATDCLQILVHQCWISNGEQSMFLLSVYSASALFAFLGVFLRLLNRDFEEKQTWQGRGKTKILFLLTKFWTILERLSIIFAHHFFFS